MYFVVSLLLHFVCGVFLEVPRTDGWGFNSFITDPLIHRPRWFPPPNAKGRSLGQPAPSPLGVGASCLMRCILLPSNSSLVPVALSFGLVRDFVQQQRDGKEQKMEREMKIFHHRQKICKKCTMERKTVFLPSLSNTTMSLAPLSMPETLLFVGWVIFHFCLIRTLVGLL